MSELWNKLDEEPLEAFEAFTAFIETKGKRDSVLKLSEKTGVPKSTISLWKKNFMWAERALAFDKAYQMEQSRMRSALIEESAISYIRKLVSRIDMMLLSSNIYMKDLSEGGREALENLSTFSKREIAMEDMDMAMKLLKAYKDILELTPEGKELLKSGAAGTEINITFTEVTKETAVVIDVENEALKLEMAEEAEIVPDEE